MSWSFFLNDHQFEPFDDSDSAYAFLSRLIGLTERLIALDLPVYFTGNLFLKNIMSPDVNISRILYNDRELKCKISRIAQQLETISLDSEAKTSYSLTHTSIETEETISFDVSRTIVTHAYEEAGDDRESVLLNFQHDYPSPLVQVDKDGANLKSIHSQVEEDGLVQLMQKAGLAKRYYSETDKHRPNDYETILTDLNLFKPTEFGNRNNRLYIRIDAPNELWCLDRGHRGRSVHLEVFRESDGQQIHVSKVDKIDFFRKLTDEEKKRILKKEKMKR